MTGSLTTLLYSTVAAAMVFFHATVPAAAEEKIAVLSYNIHHGRGMDDRIDLPRIADVILKSGADVVALQEVDRSTERNNGVDTLYELSRLTGMAYLFGGNLKYQGGDYGNAFLTRLPVTGFSNHHYRMLREGEQRGVLRASFRTPAGRILHLWNTHLDYRGDPEERLFCLEQLDELITEVPELQPLVIMGDFNTLPGRPTYKEAANRWKDAWVAVRGRDDGFTFSSVKPERRIDFHFIVREVEGFSATGADVLETTASDHLPLRIVYTIN